MSTKEFPTIERKKIVPYNGIIRFSRRLSWPDDCGMTDEVTLAISEVTVENWGRPVTIDESSSTSGAPKYSVETGLSDRLRPWIDIFLSLVRFDISFSLSLTRTPTPAKLLRYSECYIALRSHFIELLSLYSWMFCLLLASSPTFRTVIQNNATIESTVSLHVWSIASRYFFCGSFL